MKRLFIHTMMLTKLSKANLLLPFDFKHYVKSKYVFGMIRVLHKAAFSIASINALGNLGGTQTKNETPFMPLEIISPLYHSAVNGFSLIFS